MHDCVSMCTNRPLFDTCPPRPSNANSNLNDICNAEYPILRSIVRHLQISTAHAFCNCQPDDLIQQPLQSPQQSSSVRMLSFLLTYRVVNCERHVRFAGVSKNRVPNFIPPKSIPHYWARPRQSLIVGIPLIRCLIPLKPHRLPVST